MDIPAPANPKTGRRSGFLLKSVPNPSSEATVSETKSTKQHYCGHVPVGNLHPFHPDVPADHNSGQQQNDSELSQHPYLLKTPLRGVICFSPMNMGLLKF